MMHVERWHEHICQFCATQEKSLFGRNFPIKRDRPGKEFRKKGTNFLRNRRMKQKYTHLSPSSSL
ncbi:hypothetical protein ACS0TY_008293 [Phlomoides rotata]